MVDLRDANMLISVRAHEAAIVDAEARGYARGVEDAARWLEERPSLLRPMVSRISAGQMRVRLLKPKGEAK